MKVNMTPNPLDVVTIHASQGDTEARQWEFELHNNGELIDTSDVKEQLVFKAYKGGTEQLLPENGSTPTTSPFKGDIRYPQGLLTDQEFTYRQSPTEKDGLAKITDIKGNTLGWNQLVQNGNFADTSLWRTYSSTGFSVSNNVGSFTVTGSTGAIYQTNTPTYVSGHKYLVIADFYVSQQSNISVEVSGTRGKIVSVNANTWYRYSDIVTPSAQGNLSLTCGQASVQVKNVMCFDITKMGLDITDPSEFASIFSLPYYAYNQGSLLSFNGTGLKTTGKNIWPPYSAQTQSGIVMTANNDGTYTLNGTATGNAFFTINPNLSKATYRISLFNSSVNPNVHMAVQNKNRQYVLDATMTSVERKLGPLTDDIFFFFIWVNVGTTLNNYVVKPFLCMGDNIDIFEPYTESTSNIPISTYFPTGMKSTGRVWDELIDNKATKRTEKEIYTSSTGWTTRTTGSGYRLFEHIPSDIKNVGTPPSATIKSNRFEWNVSLTENNTIRQVNTTISVRKDDITSLNDWGTYLSSNPLEVIYQLATPTETSFTTASLVTENAEIPLSNEDGVLLGKCTEQLSENPGFIDAKIKLSDSDGECYSNKIQLHIERKPS